MRRDATNTCARGTNLLIEFGEINMNMPGLNFQLGEDIDALRDAVRDFAQAEIAPLSLIHI